MTQHKQAPASVKNREAPCSPSAAAKGVVTYKNTCIHRMTETLADYSQNPNVSDRMWKAKLLEFACEINATAEEFSIAQSTLEARRMIAEDMRSDVAGGEREKETG